MTEARANIRERMCTISPKGRITVEAVEAVEEDPDSVRKPPFTASMSELETLTFLAQGLTIDEASLKRGLTQYSTRQQVERLRRRNGGKKISALAAIGTELDLLNPFAIQGINILSGGPIKRYGK